jgi:hypothetical protein
VAFLLSLRMSLFAENQTNGDRMCVDKATVVLCERFEYSSKIILGTSVSAIKLYSSHGTYDAWICVK